MAEKETWKAYFKICSWCHEAYPVRHGCECKRLASDQEWLEKAGLMVKPVIPNQQGLEDMKQKGFSLIELLVVMAIIGILAISGAGYINTSSTKLKSFVFNIKARFNMARYEAIKRGQPVYLDFDFNRDGQIDDSFYIWVDADQDKNFGPGDEVIAEILVSTAWVKIYTGATDTMGTDVGHKGYAIDDGVVVVDWNGDDINRFRFNGGGDSYYGSVYFYSENGGGPWEISVNTVGRIKVKRWRDNLGWGD